MKKIINNKVYDSDKAVLLGSAESGLPGDWDYVHETLYRKRTGECFLLGEGGARSRYGRQEGDNRWVGGERIIPLSWDAAQAWAQEHLTADEYEGAFGLPDEDDAPATTIKFSAEVNQRLRKLAARRGQSLTAVLSDLIMRADA